MYFLWVNALISFDLSKKTVLNFDVAVDCRFV